MYLDTLPFPTSANYLVHLVLWGGLVFVLQWAIGFKILRPQLRVIALTTLLLGSYLILTDVVAVAFGVWFFDPQQIFGFSPLGVPIEEWLFFYLTSALVVQSLILFLPEQYRLKRSAG
jgi:lycopene cyclase domain-containing protein